MTTGESLEIIEIIDDEPDAFGDRYDGATTSETTGPRWAGPVAAAALLGLIGFGVATSTGSAPKTAPITRTSIERDAPDHGGPGAYHADRDPTRVVLRSRPAT